MKLFAISTSALLAALMLCLPSAKAQIPPGTNTATEAKSLAVLNSGAGLKEKMDACRELSRVGTEASVPALAGLLGDDQLSHSARYALETIPGKAVDQALRQALKTTQGRNLVGVIGSVGVRRDEGAVPTLKALLKSPDPDAAQAAARALGRIGGSAAVSALEAAYPGTASANRPAFWEGLLRCGDDFLVTKKESKAQAVYEWLGKVDGPPQLKTAVLRGRVRSQPKIAAQTLGSALASANYVEFAAACRFSHEITNNEVTSALLAALSKASGDRQVLLVQTLGMRRAPEAVGPVGALAARAENREARLAAIRALGQIGSPSALPFLAAFITEADADLARAAREALAASPWPEADGMILKMLADKNSDVVNLGLELAARRRLMSAYPEVLRIVRGPDAGLRVSAIKKMAELAPPDDASEPIKLFLQTTAPAELEALEQTLTTLSLRAKDREAAAALVSGAWTLAGVPQQKSMLNILAAIGGTNALNAVRAAVGSTTPEVHSAAIRALGSWSTLDAAPDLLKLAGSSTDATERMLCLRSFMKLVTDSDLKPEQLLEWCSQAQPLAQQPEEKKLLLSVLGGVNSPKALELVRPHLADAAVAEEAQNAVLRVAEKAVQAKDFSAAAGLVIPCLEQVIRETSNASVKTRAEQLLAQAQAKAAQK